MRRLKQRELEVILLPLQTLPEAIGMGKMINGGKPDDLIMFATYAVEKSGKSRN